VLGSALARVLLCLSGAAFTYAREATMEETVSRQEFESVRTELQKLIIRVEVLTQDLHRLTIQVGDLAEAIDARFDAIDSRFDATDARFDATDARFDQMERRLDAMQETLLTAILQLRR
jgi:DNA repair exonuclease SbcCD ATPase subunit